MKKVTIKVGKRSRIRFIMRSEISMTTIIRVITRAIIRATKRVIMRAMMRATMRAIMRASTKATTIKVKTARMDYRKAIVQLYFKNHSLL